MSRPCDAIAELDRLLAEAGRVPKFGLRAQGHVPTIRRMLDEGADWTAIGKAIGWCPATAREWWERLQAEER